jgi:uncharacterized protein (TIGR00255 family)
LTESMTAFARAEAETGLGKLTMEVRSVNNRFLDLGLRLADPVRSLEPLLREQIAKRVKRGRVELTVRLEETEGNRTPGSLNPRSLTLLADLQKQVRSAMPKARRLSVNEILNWPGVIERESTGDDALDAPAAALLESLLDDFVAGRRREGRRLAELIHQRIERARELVVGLEARLPDIQAHVRERLNTRIRDILDQVDPARVEQELVLLLNKSDVEEELDRLKIHLDEVKHILQQRQPVGRRLDFLMQELTREANTLGSKSAHGDVTNTSMELKVLIEQMREQVQNIE